MIGERFVLTSPHFNYDDDILEVSPLFAPFVLREESFRPGAKVQSPIAAIYRRIC